jgi:hypothetical protein
MHVRDIRVGLPVGLAMLGVLLGIAANHPATIRSASRSSIGNTSIGGTVGTRTAVR